MKNARHNRQEDKMYEKQRVIKELEEYISAADIFQILKKEKDLAFLDSSLVNQLGRYSCLLYTSDAADE